MLCIAFHPTDSNIIYAGSASGGLWKTETQGIGRYAWKSIPTGFPVLGVSSIAINPDNPDVIYIGTGEVHGTWVSNPNSTQKYTRGIFGVGILKTVDGGQSWNQVLNFPKDSVFSVNDIIFNAYDTSEIYAASTDGFYRSTNSGLTWNKTFVRQNCLDIEMDTRTDSILYLSQGNLNLAQDSSQCGIFKSTNKGQTWVELKHSGLRESWSGKGRIELHPFDQDTIYASLQDQDAQGSTTLGGLYRSNDAGLTWVKINDQNISQFQGWYSHDFAFHPTSPSFIYFGGIDNYRSPNSGVNFLQSSTYFNMQTGLISVDSPEGLPTYVHPDIHDIEFHPLIPNKAFLATDGGIQSMIHTGAVPSYTVLNGGLQTTQFYSFTSSSWQDSSLYIGGTQDQSVNIYKGDPSWYRVLLGDGMNCVIKKSNDSIIYASKTFLRIYKSTDRGNTFNLIQPTFTNDNVAFSAPYALHELKDSILYAGSNYLYRSNDEGATWNRTSNSPVDGANSMRRITLSKQDENILYLSTVPSISNLNSDVPKLFRSTDGGVSFTNITSGLPNRIATDIEVDPLNDSIVYVTFSGFNSEHVYRSEDMGTNWYSLDNNLLPDLPTNTIMVDPLDTDNIYVGNDLGIYISTDWGQSWQLFNDSLPEASMIYDLSYSPVNRKIRAATFGRGIYQRAMIPATTTGLNKVAESPSYTVYPNPTSGILNFKSIEEFQGIELSLTIMDLDGKILRQNNLNNQSYSIDISMLPTGIYFYELKGDKQSYRGKIVKQ
jgi:photosystem II stability/assembly factor-like uncharacterized protein